VIVAIPIVALVAAIVFAVPRSGRIAPFVTLAASVVVLGLAVNVARLVQSNDFVVVVPGWIGIDAFSALVLGLIALVYFTAALFSWGYVAREERGDRRLRIYYANFNVFAFSMLAIPLLVEVGLVWIFVELTTVSSILLVSYAGSSEAIEAAWKYMVLTLLGATIAVLGVLVLYWALHVSGSTDFTWDGLRTAAPHMPPLLVAVAFALLLVGYGAKVGLVPLHTWLPDAHSQAPSPVCAMLSGIETSVVLYVILRLRPTFAADPLAHVGTWFAFAGLLSVAVAALLIVQTQDYKRLFAFSTVEHMGIILAAAGIGTPAADLAALWQLIAHTATKSFCFYAAGLTLLATNTRRIADVRGLLGSSRAAAAAFLIGTLAIGGAPPFAVFLSELAIFRAGILANAYAIVVILLVFVVFAFFGLLAHATRMLSGEPTAHPRTKLPATCVAAVALAAIPVAVLGFWMPAGMASLLEHAARTFGGG
jgi:hydrogenase-4 component F